MTPLARELERERLVELPARCRRLVAGLDNDANDPTLVFEGLPYSAVMAAALHHADVRDALELLPRRWRGWARE